MFKRYLLSSVLRSPDEPSGDAAVIEPVVAEVAAEPVIEQQLEEPVKAPKSSDPPWYIKRISQESAKAQREEEGRIAAERARDEALALAQRLQAGKEEAAPALRQQPPPQADFNSEVQKAAAKQVLYNDIADIDRLGKASLGVPFVEAVNVLRAVGGTTDEFLSDVLAAVDKRDAPALLSAIAQDPENAANLAQMNSRQRIAELTRMSVAVAAKPAEEAVVVPAKVAAPKLVSKAPAPAPVVQPSASKTIDWRSDEASDADFHKGWESHQAERMKSRRR